MKHVSIAAIPGDGVGKEVVPEAIRVLKAISDVHGGLSFTFQDFPWSCEYYLEHGEMMPKDGLEQLKAFDSIFLGAVGDANLVPDHVSLWGLLIKFQREFEQVINVRPAKQLSGIGSPLAQPKDLRNSLL
ncbi:tartrate dehydrogenase [Bacillus safensis FO-36b] [Bacillus safensis subsp. safensis]